jgi:anti-sigma factor RsiW
MSSLNDQDRANLVAYLDGELDEPAARDLEARLNLDPAARAEAESLRKTWELLDYLPRPEPSASFTHRTLEKLAVHAPPSSPGVARRPGWPWWALGIGWAAAVVLAAGGGLAAAHLWWSAEALPTKEGMQVEEVMARYPQLLEHQRVFEPVDNLEFLRALDVPELFSEEDPGL